MPFSNGKQQTSKLVSTVYYSSQSYFKSVEFIANVYKKWETVKNRVTSFKWQYYYKMYINKKLHKLWKLTKCTFIPSWIFVGLGSNYSPKYFTVLVWALPPLFSNGLWERRTRVIAPLRASVPGESEREGHFISYYI